MCAYTSGVNGWIARTCLGIEISSFLNKSLSSWVGSFRWKMVGSGSELSGLKAIEALPKLKPGFAGGVFNHSLDKQRQDLDLHMGFDALR